jgi:glutaminyl-peptide cyclotransferase
VPVCHLIPVPFPKQWHKIDDNAANLDEETIWDLALIFRVLIVEYFGLAI